MSNSHTASPFYRISRDAPGHWTALATVTTEEAATFVRSLAALTEAADPRDLRDLSTVVAAANADPSILAPPGISDDEHHRRRNLLAALCCTAELRGDPSAGALLAEVSRLPRRTMLLRGRPLRDDERLLMRLIVTSLLRKGSIHHIAAAKYALSESGCTPGETTAAFVHHLDHPRHPRHIVAVGNRDRQKRELDLDDWQSEVIGVVASTQAAHGDLDKPIAYRGDHQPGSAPANMSCHRSLDILLSRAGLWHQGDITASSITYSAADRIQQVQGIRAAIRALGRDNTAEAVRHQRAARDLRRFGTQPSDKATPPVTSFLTEPFERYGRESA